MRNGHNGGEFCGFGEKTNWLKIFKHIIQFNYIDIVSFGY